MPTGHYCLDRGDAAAAAPSTTVQDNHLLGYRSTCSNCCCCRLRSLVRTLYINTDLLLMTVGAIRARAPCPNTIWRTSEAMLTKEKPTRAYCSSRSSPRPLARWIPGAMHTTWARKMVAGVQAAEQVVEDWGVTYIVLSRGQERTCAMDDLDQCTRTAAICMFSARLSLRAVSPVLTLSEGHTAARIGAADVDNTTQRMMHPVYCCARPRFTYILKGQISTGNPCL